MTHALKPSGGRFPIKGSAGNKPQVPICGTVAAPMCTDLLSLKTLCKAVLGNLPTEQDAQLLNIPWRKDQCAMFDVYRPPSRQPRLAILFDDGHVRPHPPVRRLLGDTLAALRQAGYEVVLWDPPAHEPAIRILFQILGADGLTDVRKTLDEGEEPPVSQLKT